MKLPLSAALIALLAVPSLRAQEAPKDEKDKVSYIIGNSIGKSMKRDGVEINQQMLDKGLADGLSGAKPLIPEEEAQKTMQAFQQAMQEKMMKKRQELGEKNKAAGEAFLAENKKKEGVQTLPSGLQYKVITTGTGGKPKSTDTVEVNYRGTLIDGTEFDSSYKRNQPVSFPVGQVIPGWTEALQLMPVGSKWQLFIPSGLAYGENAPPSIGANSVLLFDVELLGIKKEEAAKPVPSASPVSVTTEPVSAPSATPQSSPKKKKK
jgi:FKBP-type peptidyl-prolyl cis-trans isomerase FklB